MSKDCALPYIFPGSLTSALWFPVEVRSSKYKMRWRRQMSARDKRLTKLQREPGWWWWEWEGCGGLKKSNGWRQSKVSAISLICRAACHQFSQTLHWPLRSRLPAPSDNCSCTLAFWHNFSSWQVLPLPTTATAKHRTFLKLWTTSSRLTPSQGGSCRFAAEVSFYYRTQIALNCKECALWSHIW